MNRRFIVLAIGAAAVLAGLGGLAVFLSGGGSEAQVEGASLAKSVQRSAVSGAVIHAETFHDLNGQKQALGQWAGKHLLINFWATWCPPCVEEMPRLNAWSASSPKNIQIVGIAADSVANVEKFRNQHRISFPLMIEEAKSIEFSKRLGNRTGLLPFSVLLDPGGEVVATFLGVLDDDKIQQITRISSNSAKDD
ncbi:MAG: TlpA family protein disulfide reductase [Betaproteobacteria bacterium]|nr:TlpA family protein disulfide reductase [Betaproteobacteria bacterium]